MDMEINFPNLGIYLDHVGKNISIFGFSIAYYGIVIVTGMMIAIWIAQREAKRTGQNPEQYLDLAMIGIAAGILGARIYYVIFAWDYYKDDLLSIFNIRQGGLAIYGGIIGACGGDLQQKEETELQPSDGYREHEHRVRSDYGTVGKLL